MNKLKKQDEGFTIIEVVLVLAIAGLIFLIVFIALPQLQRSRRDTQRRNDAGRIVAAAESFASNTNGTYPEEIDSSFQTQYMNEMNDPSNGNPYAIHSDSDLSGEAAGTVWGQRGAVCGNAEGQLDTSTARTDRDFAVLLRLEQGTYCQDNQ